MNSLFAICKCFSSDGTLNNHNQLIILNNEFYSISTCGLLMVDLLGVKKVKANIDNILMQQKIHKRTEESNMVLIGSSYIIFKWT